MFIMYSCNQPGNDQITNLQLTVDSLELKYNQLQDQLNYFKKISPKVEVTNIEASICQLRLFVPFGLNLKLTVVRPSYNDQTYLCIPAAYTTKSHKVDGLCYIQGSKIETLNPELLGVCVIGNDKIEIVKSENITPEFLDWIKTARASMFQQTLLLKDSTIIDCNFPIAIRERRHLRRALVQFENSFCIAESEKQLTIEEFQQILLEIGVVDAINLDMGTWSEGWYKNSCCSKVTIGETMNNTNKQTSWLTYSRN